MTGPKDRVDKVLVDAGLVSSRSQALLLIEEGVVFYQNELVEKASKMVTAETLEVRKAVQYVSRGAHKIEGALARFQIAVSDKMIADVGASTGGFTDFILKAGAKKVYCLDVGHDQLAAPLRSDSRVVNFEGVNIKFPYELPEKVDIAVVDLSFISIKLVLKNIFDLTKADGKIVALIKPQFEVGQSGLDHNGIVKSEGHRLVMLHELKEWCKAQGFVLIDKEYFFYFDKGRK
jgi:23S rRNA (cytidine1920-2'-O)/16S rRNA (cytidine1409-2'-O)-methyltransferase